MFPSSLLLIPVSALNAASAKFASTLSAIETAAGSLESFSRGYEYYGFNRTEQSGKRGILYREWAPNAVAASLVGDFNGWNSTANPLTRNEFVRAHNPYALIGITACFAGLSMARSCYKSSQGVFSTFLEDGPDGSSAIPHDSFVKVFLRLPSGEGVFRVPAWIKYATYVEEHT